MLIKSKGKFICQCDICNSMSPPLPTWDSYMSYLISNRYDSYKSKDGKWRNKCPKCNGIEDRSDIHEISENN